MTQLPVVRGGKTYNIYWKLSIPSPAPPVFAPYSPQLQAPPLALPKITIFDPTDATQTAATNMTQVNDSSGNPIVGTYVYAWSSPTSPLGIYSCWVDCVDPSSNPAGSADQVDVSESTPFVQVV